jgi:hypothetical protein
VAHADVDVGAAADAGGDVVDVEVHVFVNAGLQAERSDDAGIRLRRHNARAASLSRWCLATSGVVWRHHGYYPQLKTGLGEIEPESVRISTNLGEVNFDIKIRAYDTNFFRKTR